MLQQTRVQTAAPYWERWMKTLPDVRAFARARSPQVHKLWEGLGYYARARNAHAAARLIVEKHGGKFPKSFAAVLALPGVWTLYGRGRLQHRLPSAGSGFGRECDAGFEPGFWRAGRSAGKAANARLWALARELVFLADPPNRGRLNEALMELGALVCAPRQPRCTACPLRWICFARRRDRVGEFPGFKARRSATRRRFLAFLVQRNGCFLARRRPDGGVNARLWEFPNVEIAPGEKNPASAAAPFLLAGPAPLCRVRHSITRSRIVLEAYRAQLPGRAAEAAAPGVWRTPAQLERLAFTSAHRKILAALQNERDRPGRSTRRPPGDARAKLLAPARVCDTVIH